MQLFFVLVLATAGALLHYVVSWLNGKLCIDLYTYLTHDKISTLKALSGIALSSIYFVAAGNFDGSSQSIALAILAGYSCDSALNKPGTGIQGLWK